MTEIVIRSQDDFINAMVLLLPRGRAWNYDPDSNMLAALLPFALTDMRVFNACVALLVDAFPKTTVDLLPEWESSLGLPDPCLGANPTIAQRQTQVVARLTDTGGQSLPYFAEFAAALGYKVSLTVFRPAIAGRDIAGKCIILPASAANWLLVNAQPLAAQNTVLECELEARVRATTELGFTYTFGIGASGDFSATDFSSDFDIGQATSGDFSSTDFGVDFNIGTGQGGDFSTTDFGTDFNTSTGVSNVPVGTNISTYNPYNT